MTRPSFAVTLRGPTETSIHNGPWTSSTEITGYASEQVFGVQRKKPEGPFIAPTSYMFSRDVLDRGYGTVEGDVGFYLDVAKNSFRKRGNLYYDSQSGQVDGIGDLFTLDDLQVPFAMQNEALIDARLGMKRGDLNLGVAFAERKQAMRMVGDTAKKFAHTIDALQMKDFKKVGDLLGIAPPKKTVKNIDKMTVPQGWLALQYGWLPFVSDVYGVVEALAGRDRYGWRVTSKGARSDRINRIRVKDSVGPRVRYEGSADRKVYVRIDAVPDNDLLLALSSLGVTNPLVVGWERLGFSFVVDWFLPVGDFLYSLDAMLGYKEIHCSISSLVKAKASAVLENGRTGLPWDWTECRVSASPCKMERVRLERSVLGSVPQPRMPAIKDPRSVAHLANGLSLLATAFGRHA